MRTMVLPQAMASSKSSVIPIDKKSIKIFRYYLDELTKFAEMIYEIIREVLRLRFFMIEKQIIYK